MSQNIEYLWQNKRILSLIETDSLGFVAFIAIGATCVGSIAMTKGEGASIARGEELGCFSFGGSCVITLFEVGKARLADDLLHAYGPGMELFAKVRDEAATVLSK